MLWLPEGSTGLDTRGSSLNSWLLAGFKAGAVQQCQGTAPQQMTAEDEFLTNPTSSVGFSGEDFYGDEDFDMDELDAEGFMDMGPEDLY